MKREREREREKEKYLILWCIIINYVLNDTLSWNLNRFYLVLIHSYRAKKWISKWFGFVNDNETYQGNKIKRAQARVCEDFVLWANELFITIKD